MGSEMCIRDRIPATQVNMRAGDLPEEENNGVKYLKIPIDNL